LGWMQAFFPLFQLFFFHNVIDCVTCLSTIAESVSFSIFMPY
jgi:hypothetical protein